MKQPVIVGAVRTAIGSFGGTLKDISPVELTTLVIEEALRRAGIEPQEVDETVFGCILQAGHGQNIARQAALKAGLLTESPAMMVNILCGSGLKAIEMGATSISLGKARVVVAGGVESMSQAPYLLPKARSGYRLGHGEIVDSLIKDGLTCAVNDVHMGVTAENIAEKYGISRQAQDAFAVESQERAAKAIAEERFGSEIVSVAIPQRKKEPIIFDTDEYPRKASVEDLARLRPVFKKDGTVTAGNASGINDGAAAVVIMDEEEAKSAGIPIMARIKGTAVTGVDPAFMGMGPVSATNKVLQELSLKISDIELAELNEAFAAQSLAVIQELKIDPKITNVNGGAIALGHPVGASGARVLVTLLYEMIRRDNTLGLASLCTGGGMGISTILERA